MQTLKTKEGRDYASRLLLSVLPAGTEVQKGEGEGQGEVSFDEFSILGGEDRDGDTFSVSLAVSRPATRWEPEDADVVEEGTYRSLDEAILAALKLHAGKRIEALLEAEYLAMSYREEEE